jgi:hypothetical protein
VRDGRLHWLRKDNSLTKHLVRDVIPISIVSAFAGSSLGAVFQEWFCFCLSSAFLYTSKGGFGWRCNLGGWPLFMIGLDGLLSIAALVGVMEGSRELERLVLNRGSTDGPSFD